VSTKDNSLTQEEIFDRMAPGWYSRRHWTIFRPELEELAEKWRQGRLLNIGCGHGADFLPFSKSFQLYGLDISAGMLHYAEKYARKFNFSVGLVHGDASNLPFSGEAFDWAISVAAYHHLDNTRDRQNAFLELKRVLKPGGQAFVTVWNRWQPAFWLKPKEVRVSWRTKETDLPRYYYLFSRRELENMVRKSGFRILRSYSEASYRLPVKQFSRNICLLLEKSIDKQIV
jgi:ubiquinone/menaquinone biosynthesis C-methylase UbiE